ncbi:MAG: archease [Candidatus Micrarchaeota archaeon]
MPYVYLEHKADVLIEATGKDFPEAIECAAKGMADVIANVGEKDTFDVEREAESLEDLVVDTLAWLLAESEVLEMPFSRLKVKKFGHGGGKFMLSGTAYGEKDAPKKGSVKAVTYHELSVKEEKERVTIRVLLDV